MTIEERIASALRTQTDLLQPPPLDLAVVRAGARAQTRRRTAIALSAFALVVASVGVVALALDGPDRAPQPAKPLPGENGVIVHATELGPGGTSSAEVASLPDPSAAPYPAWNAFDQDTGRFLFTTDVERGPRHWRRTCAISGSSLRGGIRRWRTSTASSSATGWRPSARAPRK